MLSGGGSFGFWHFGVVRALFEANLLPRVVSGSSAGSIGARAVRLGLCGTTPTSHVAMRSSFPCCTPYTIALLHSTLHPSSPLALAAGGSLLCTRTDDELRGMLDCFHQSAGLDFFVSRDARRMWHVLPAFLQATCILPCVPTLPSSPCSETQPRPQWSSTW